LPHGSYLAMQSTLVGADISPGAMRAGVTIEVES
jgi:hypothetical protein